MISKEGLTVLIQLVNLAQKRGAYNLEESYLAFMVLKDVIDDPKYKRAVEAVKELFPENVTNKYVINRPSRAWMYVVRQHTYYTQDNNYSTYKLPISQC